MSVNKPAFTIFTCIESFGVLWDAAGEIVVLLHSINAEELLNINILFKRKWCEVIMRAMNTRFLPSKKN